jgi:hypothetical protein
MTTPPQPGADRAHPTGSTGPRSAAGKGRSSMNALKTGIYANSLIIPGEDPADLATLTEEYFQRYRPSAPEQRDQVDILVRSTWTLRRLGAAEAQVWIYEMDRTCELNPTAPLGQAFCACDHTLTRLQRIVNSTQRNYRDALHELERLQALPLDIPPPASRQAPQPTAQPAETEPISPSPQFVPSSSTPPPPAAPTDAQNPLPFHYPGSRCIYEPRDPLKYKQCPFCFPQRPSPNAQE